MIGFGNKDYVPHSLSVLLQHPGTGRPPDQFCLLNAANVSHMAIIRLNSRHHQVASSASFRRLLAVNERTATACHQRLDRAQLTLRPTGYNSPLKIADHTVHPRAITKAQVVSSVSASTKRAVPGSSSIFISI